MRDTRPGWEVDTDPTASGKIIEDSHADDATNDTKIDRLSGVAAPDISPEDFSRLTKNEGRFMKMFQRATRWSRGEPKRINQQEAIKRLRLVENSDDRVDARIRQVYAEAMRSQDPMQVQHAIRELQRGLEATDLSGQFDERVFHLPYKVRGFEHQETKLDDIVTECINRLIRHIIDIGAKRRDVGVIEDALWLDNPDKYARAAFPYSYTSPSYRQRMSEVKSENRRECRTFYNQETCNHWLNSLFNIAMTENDPKKFDQIYQLIDKYLQQQQSGYLNKPTEATGKHSEESWQRHIRSFMYDGIIKKPTYTWRDRLNSREPYLRQTDYDYKGDDGEYHHITEEQWTEKVYSYYMLPLKKRRRSLMA